jgi:CRP/FNR family cyclic AMP-dependent transcriptional regulator
MLLGGADYKANFKAREECKIAEIPTADFLRICQRHPECLLRMTTQLAQRLNCSDDRIHDLVFLDVTGRVENALNYLASSPAAITHPNGMQIRITRQEIGSLVGCSREMVGRAIKELSLAEKISVDGKNIVIFS